ncbi:hypothetical protein [Mycoplasmopsis pulmonis]|uniref:hypothetical protein n=1 Tax=Mycoplasmopsis pulmonis TaxID=2107 RepID=UPI002ACD20B5|nr:hypothetical protein [Mycoplasmopsis pulmonis]MDZ7293259.1 hypothetical protein [Mycoplasmopsis pulmonis]
MKFKKNLKILVFFIPTFSLSLVSCISMPNKKDDSFNLDQKDKNNMNNKKSDSINTNSNEKKDNNLDTKKDDNSIDKNPNQDSKKDMNLDDKNSNEKKDNNLNKENPNQNKDNNPLKSNDKNLDNQNNEKDNSSKDLTKYDDKIYKNIKKDNYQKYKTFFDISEKINRDVYLEKEYSPLSFNMQNNGSTYIKRWKIDETKISLWIKIPKSIFSKTYILKYQEGNSSEIDNISSKATNEKDVFLFEIENLIPKQKITINSILDYENKEINNFVNKDFQLITKNNLAKNSRYILQSIGQKIYNVKSPDKGTYELSLRNKEVSTDPKLDDYPKQIYLQIADKNQIKEIELSYPDNWKNQVDYKWHQVKFDNSDIELKTLWIIGIGIKNSNGEIENLDSSSLPTFVDHEEDLLKFRSEEQLKKFKLGNAIRIDKNLKKGYISYFNNFPNEDNAPSKVDLIFKSEHYIRAYQKIIQGNINKATNQIEFNLDDLNQEEDGVKFFVLTHLMWNNHITNLKIGYKFQHSILRDKINLEKFDYHTDKENKKIYASAFLDLNENELLEIQNKAVEFNWTFQKEKGLYSNINYDKLSEIVPFKVKQIIPFKDLAKFELINFPEKMDYKLISIRIVEPITLQSYSDENQIFIPELLKKELNYNFDYLSNSNKFFDSSTISKTNKNNLDSELDQFFSQKLDLLQDDLINANNQNLNKNYLPFSIQNFLSYIHYSKSMELAKHFGVSSNHTNYIFKKNNQKYDVFILRGREILKNTIGTINKDHTSWEITKDLTKFKNLEKLDPEDIIFNLSLKIDPYFVPLINSSIAHQNFNEVSIPISYKLIKEKKNLSDIYFENLHFYGNKEITNDIKNKIAHFLKFDASLEDNKLTFKISSRLNNTKIFDYRSSHNLSREKSFFIGTNNFDLFYLKSKDASNQSKIFFQEKKIDEHSSDLNEILIDSNLNSNQAFDATDKNSDYDMDAKRLFREDKSKALDIARQRTFSFLRTGTFSVIGKVKPNDPSDYRYYIVTNNHVYSELIKKENQLKRLLDNSQSRETLSLLLPNKTQHDRQYEKYIHNNKHIFRINKSSDYQNEITIVENFISFSSSMSSEDSQNFKDTLGDKVNNKTDMSILIIDFSYFFKKFKGIDFSNENTKVNRHLDPNEVTKTTKDENFEDGPNYQWNNFEKEAIKFILNLEKLPPLKISKELKYLQTYQNFNWYITTIPKSRSLNKDSGIQAAERYREYLYANHFGRLIKENENYGLTNSIISIFSKYNVDTASGSSGSSILDSNGNLAGLHFSGDRALEDDFQNGNFPIPKGTLVSSSFFMMDGHKIVNYGSLESRTNPSSFAEKIKKNSFLYPERYEDIFK